MNLISFTIKDDYGTVLGTYNAERGMTWEQWVNSSYNTDNYKIVNTLAAGERVVRSKDRDLAGMMIDENVITSIESKEYQMVYY